MNISDLNLSAQTISFLTLNLSLKTIQWLNCPSLSTIIAMVKTN